MFDDNGSVLLAMYRVESQLTDSQAALLIMSDEDAQCIELPSSKMPQTRHVQSFTYTADNQQYLIRTWYASALYCLERADFMRHDHIHSVQAIAILGICFNGLGDNNVFSSLWACGIRIGHRLGMNRTSPQPIMGLAGHWCNRLWWTLMICEW